jgi:hypothetical protein
MGDKPDAKNNDRNADGFGLWLVQHAGVASCSIEWGGDRLFG